MGEVTIYAIGDDQCLEGQLADVISTLREFPNATEHMLGVMVGVALSGMISGLREFHIQDICDTSPCDPNYVRVRITLSTIDNVGWGLTFLEDQKPRVIQ